MRVFELLHVEKLFFGARFGAKAYSASRQSPVARRVPLIEMVARIGARPPTITDTLFDAERFHECRTHEVKGFHVPAQSIIQLKKLQNRLAAPPPSAIELITYPRNDPSHTLNRHIDLHNEQ